MRKNIILLCLFLGLLGTSCSNSNVEDKTKKDEMAALERVREKIQHEEKIKKEEKIEEEKQIEKEQKQEKKSEKVKVENLNISSENVVNEYLKEKKKLEEVSKKNPQTEIEKLRETQKLANEKVNFYERVVRSVAREEKDILKHKERLNKDKLEER